MPRRHAVAVLSIALALFGCGKAGTDPGQDDLVMAKAAASGDGQSGPLGTVLANPLRVILTRGGNPVAGQSVTWQSQASLQLNPGTTSSGADGIASTIVTLPPFGSTPMITATAAGATGSPQVFTVTATGAGTQVNVDVVNNQFVPPAFNLKAGGTVTFTWSTNSGPHNVTPVAPNVIPASSNPAPPGTHLAPYTFDVTFPAAGAFKFFCGVHGSSDSGMHGTITVVP